MINFPSLKARLNQILGDDVWREIYVDRLVVYSSSILINAEIEFDEMAPPPNFINKKRNKLTFYILAENFNLQIKNSKNFIKRSFVCKINEGECVVCMGGYVYTISSKKIEFYNFQSVNWMDMVDENL